VIKGLLNMTLSSSAGKLYKKKSLTKENDTRKIFHTVISLLYVISPFPPTAHQYLLQLHFTQMTNLVLPRSETK
jgi:hypothetical protein